FGNGIIGVTAMALQPDGRILAQGRFSGGLSSLIRLNADGSLDRTFRRADISESVKFVLQPDGKILIPTSDGRVVRLQADGSPDAFSYQGPTLGAGMTISGAMAVQADGKILVAFHLLNAIGSTLRPFVRVNADGSRDTSFNSGTGLGVDFSFITIADM